MIPLEKVLLLQNKVNAAVEKIGQLNNELSQLKEENDALRKKCAELTNSLSDKTEQVSTLEAEQNQIEQGILLALDRLNSVENSVLNSANAMESVTQKNSTFQQEPAEISAAIQDDINQNAEENLQSDNQPEVQENPEPVENSIEVPVYENNSNPGDTTEIAAPEFDTNNSNENLEIF